MQLWLCQTKINVPVFYSVVYVLMHLFMYRNHTHLRIVWDECNSWTLKWIRGLDSELEYGLSFGLMHV